MTYIYYVTLTITYIYYATYTITYIYYVTHTITSYSHTPCEEESSWIYNKVEPRLQKFINLNSTLAKY